MTAKSWPVFDLIFSAMSAYTQIGMLTGAAVCGGLAALLLGNALYWRLFAHRVRATTLGVIQDGGTYSAVYRYTLPDGTTHEAKSDIGTGWLRGYDTGRVVRVMIAPRDPEKARRARSVVLEAVGLILLVPTWLFARAALANPVTPMTGVVGLLLVAWLGWRGWLKLSEESQSLRATLDEFRHFLPAAVPAHPTAAPIDLSCLRPAEEIARSAPLPAGGLGSGRNRGLALVVLALFAVIFAGIGAYQGARVMKLEVEGIRTDGKVVRLDEEESSGDDAGWVYYAVVSFRTAAGATVEFRDGMGSDPPMHQPGEHVEVLYLSSTPREAMIDGGLVWNLFLPAIFMLFGFAAAGLALVIAFGARPQKRAVAGLRKPPEPRVLNLDAPPRP